MALSAAALGALIDSNLQGFGANGSNKTSFSNAVAKGIVNSIVGASFATVDTGLTPGTGAGTGTGILGLSASSMKSIALGLMSSQGENAGKLMEAIMNAVVSHLSAAATLTSTHSPVYLGSGTVTVGSILVVPATMGANINSELLAIGANGTNRSNLSTAIGTGVASNILSSGTGTVTITGSPSGTPVPGSGSGTGVIS